MISYTWLKRIGYVKNCLPEPLGYQYRKIKPIILFNSLTLLMNPAPATGDTISVIYFK